MRDDNKLSGDDTENGSDEEGGEDVRLSPSRIGLYVECPRKYQYEAVWDTEAKNPFRRQAQQSIALHDAIHYVTARIRADDPEDPSASWRDADAIEERNVPWEIVSEDDIGDDRLRAFADAEFQAAWKEHTTRGEYRSDADYEYDRRIAAAGLAAYLNDRGIDDIRRSMATELPVSFERDGVPMTGRIDNVVRSDEGVEILDYKRRLSSVVSGHREYLEEHLSGDRFDPRRVKSLIQAEVYATAVEQSDLIGVGDSVEVTFYGLLNDSDDVVTAEGVIPDVSPGDRSVGWIRERDTELSWELIRTVHESIQAKEYSATERMEERVDEVCADCRYNDMCPEAIELEVVRVE